MKFKSDYLKNYLKRTPFSLASERVLECKILEQQSFDRPILDIGCGDGIFAHLLFDENVDTGVDINPTEVDRCRELGAYQELLVCSADSIPKPDSYYNTIFSNSVLEHIPNLDAVLKEAHRILSDKGVFYITVPTDNFEKAAAVSCMLDFFKMKSLKTKFMKFYNKFWRHYHTYTLEGWSDVFNRNGFKIIKFQEYNKKPRAFLHDLFVPVAIPAFFSRRYFKRWFFFPWLRKISVPFLYSIFSPILERLEKSKNQDTLVFFKLAKTT